MVCPHLSPQIRTNQDFVPVLFFSMHREKRLFLSLCRGQHRKGVFLDASGKTMVLIFFLSPFYISIYREKKEKKKIYIRICAKWGQIVFFSMHRKKRNCQKICRGQKISPKSGVFLDASGKTGSPHFAGNRDFSGTKWGQKGTNGDKRSKQTFDETAFSFDASRKRPIFICPRFSSNICTFLLIFIEQTFVSHC